MNRNSDQGSNREGEPHQELGRAQVLHQPEEEVVDEAPKKSGHIVGEEKGKNFDVQKNLFENSFEENYFNYFELGHVLNGLKNACF